jgi:hypothetical protein
MVSKISLVTLLLWAASGNAFSIDSKNSNRRSFIADIATVTTAVGVASTIGTSPALAAPEILNLQSGIKFAITKPSEKGNYPQGGDIVAVEYTGYLANGQVRNYILIQSFEFHQLRLGPVLHSNSVILK